MCSIAATSKATFAMLDNSASVLPNASPAFLWNEIVRWTFEACILRKEGREEKVQGLLTAKLPALIRAWSSRCGRSAEECRAQLKGLFSRAQESVELGFIQRRIIVEEISSLLGRTQAAATALETSAKGVGLRRQIPIDDIPAMLDALAEAEIESRGEALLPLRRSVAAPAAELLAEPVGAQA